MGVVLLAQPAQAQPNSPLRPAARYMLEKHPADMDTVFGHYRTGQRAAARTHLTTTGTRYGGAFRTWLAGCAAGGCGDGSTVPVNSHTLAVTDPRSGAHYNCLAAAVPFGGAAVINRLLIRPPHLPAGAGRHPRPPQLCQSVPGSRPPEPKYQRQCQCLPIQSKTSLGEPPGGSGNTGEGAQPCPPTGSSTR
ncbi:collagenase [Streptomyces sp. NPDC058375]|uniref:collagenase n=1 Tax=Streptomyces sp. NPDC058375 TaxID=3346467 RepID=UPI0036680B7D